MRAEELKNGIVVCHTKYNRNYCVTNCNMRMKDSQKGWIDSVVYAPLYDNEYDAFCREKESFLEEFEVDNGYLSINHRPHKKWTALRPNGEKDDGLKTQ